MQALMRDNEPRLRSVGKMGQGKNRHESLLQQLIARAKRLNIDVRTEKLLREVGYRVHSGRCRLKGHALIILDRDAPITDHVDFLAAELNKEEPAPTQPPPNPGNS